MSKSTLPASLTMADIARLAGVSPTTVSRALAGSTAVREETRRKVLRIAEEAGYRLNEAARNLRRQRSNAIAVVVEIEPSSPCSMRLIARSIGRAGCSS